MSFGSGEPEGYTVADSVVEPEALSCGPDLRFESSYASERYITESFLAQPDDVEVWGSVQGAKTGTSLLSEGDLVYLNLDDPGAVACGDLVSLFVEGEDVRHPESRRVRYGKVWRVGAIARIVHVDDEDRVTAVIRDSYHVVHRGDLVGPAFPVEGEFPVDPPKGDLEGTIIARAGQDTYNLASVGETVFIDLGKDDGLREGNSFYVVQHRDEMISMFDDQDFVPDQVVGRVVLTRVDDATSTGVVVDAASPIRVGDQVATVIQ